ncbi:hypothetical protein Pcinc_030957 [Petrolisthes cinctipes]|uniref:Uncharacterized protein n=1 Tax=Petrolisthes cinctipes TaxID=88211 RepID=A0AAE1EXM4_PETCI|nr:hypothetical protein Pcinc_030957 [Petrolisthes cinctipes]
MINDGVNQMNENVHSRVEVMDMVMLHHHQGHIMINTLQARNLDTSPGVMVEVSSRTMTMPIAELSNIWTQQPVVLPQNAHHQPNPTHLIPGPG